jgi:predicted murein hydrolase (TIGR00659 family)
VKAVNELLNLELFSIVLTLLAFRLGQLLQNKTKSPICNPILVAVILVLGFMALTGLENSTYQAACSRLSWLMTPATVCLAIPMYEQLKVLRKNLGAILAGVAAGAVSCLIFLLVFAGILGFDRELIVSLLPKSVTTAIGVPLSTLSGGVASITTAAIILTGITGAVLGPVLCKLFRLKDEISRGVAFGTAGHVIGTAKANEFSPLTGAVSSLSLVVAGLLTALVMPLLLP